MHQSMARSVYADAALTRFQLFVSSFLDGHEELERRLILGVEFVGKQHISCQTTVDETNGKPDFSFCHFVRRDVWHLAQSISTTKQWHRKGQGTPSAPLGD